MVQMHNAIGACAWLTRLVFAFLGSPGFLSSWLAWIWVSIVAENATHVFLRSRALESVRSEVQNLPSHPSQSQPNNPNPTPQLPPPLCSAPPKPTPHTPQLQYTGSIPTAKKDVTSKCTTAALCSSFAITTLAGCQTSLANSFHNLGVKDVHGLKKTV